MAALAVWSAEIQPGKDFTFTPRSSVRVTNAALGETLENESARSTLKLNYEQLNIPDLEDEDDEDDNEDKEPGMVEKNTILCSLTPGKIEQCTLDVVLVDDIKYVLTNTGENTIHLSGNYIDNDMDGEPDSDEELDDDDDPAVYLDEVSSDVEVDPNDIDMLDDDDEDRFEEVDEAKGKAEKPATLKRPRDEDGAEAQGDKKLSKKQQKKLNKKLRAENGDAVPAGDEPSSPAKSSTEKPVSEKSGKDKKDGEGKKDKKYKELSGGLKFRDAHSKGNGPQAKKGDKVKMRYIGKLPDGKIFDQNTSGKPFVFTLGKGEVIKGWDEGIVSMSAGGERELIIPPEMAYGKKGQGSTIPPNTTLRFECKLLGIN